VFVLNTGMGEFIISFGDDYISLVIRLRDINKANYIGAKFRSFLQDYGVQEGKLNINPNDISSFHSRFYV
jgi:hypothetical protein